MTIKVFNWDLFLEEFFLLNLSIFLDKIFCWYKSSDNIDKKLEKLVALRTADLSRKEKILSAQNKKLMEYAHMTSHVLRKPLANILGVINYLESHEPEDIHTREEMFHVIKDAALEMDETVIESINILSEKFEFEDDSKPEPVTAKKINTPKPETELVS